MDLSKVTLHPDFLDSPSGRLFTLLYKPATESANEHSDTVIVLCPAFAEEMNKCRRMVSEQARQFCAAGYTVLVFDLFGTGDSEGEFNDGNIALWRQNYADIFEWLRQEGFSSSVLWAMRFGALFVEGLARNTVLPVKGALLWQPDTSGKRALRQFMRLQSAANIMTENKGKSVSEMEADLQRGENAEVAGYGISSTLYQQSAELQLISDEFTPICPIHWMHVAIAPQAEAPPVTIKLISRLQEQGQAIDLHVIDGQNFWSPNWVVVIPELLECSNEALQLVESSDAH